MKLVPYSHELDAAWDSFVVNDSRNGGIFHERKFLSYHPKGRFDDASIVFFSGDNIVGVLPAAKQTKEDNKIHIISHPGSTTGGLVYHKQHGLREVLLMLEETISHYNVIGANLLEMRLAEALFSHPTDGELTYLLWHRGFKLHTREISSCINLQADSDWIEYGRKKNMNDIRRLLRSGFTVDRVDDATIVYPIISNNLDNRYQKKPTHSLNDLLDLKQRYSERIHFWVANSGEKPVATVVIFIVNKYAVHDFYIAQDYEFAKLQVMPLLFYKMFDYYKISGYKWFNFGISSRGDWIKWGILEFKEHIGGRATFREVWIMDDLSVYRPYKFG